MTRSRVAMIALGLACVLPSAARAQGGLPGSMGQGAYRSSFSLKRQSPVQIPVIVQPLDLLIMHRQDLALTDSQFFRVIRMKRVLDSLNSPLMRRLDSVQRLFKGGTLILSQTSPERQDSVDRANRLVDEVVGQVRDNIAPARERAYDILSSSQREQAERFEDQALSDAEKDKPGRGGT